MQDCTRGAEKDLSHGSSPFDPLASRSEEHTSELQSRLHLVCRLLLEKKKNRTAHRYPETPPSLRDRTSPLISDSSRSRGHQSLDSLEWCYSTSTVPESTSRPIRLST